MRRSIAMLLIFSFTVQVRTARGESSQPAGDDRLVLEELLESIDRRLNPPPPGPPAPPGLKVD